MKPERGDQHIPEDIRVALQVTQRAWVIAIGKHAARTAAIIDPSLDPNNVSQGKTPDNIPQEVLGAARDLADYLDGSRVPPETNRHSIPHAQGWELDHAMHLIRDLAYAVNEAREEIPPEVQIKVLQELLDISIDAALLSRYEENRPFLKRLAAGIIEQQ